MASSAAFWTLASSEVTACTTFDTEERAPAAGERGAAALGPGKCGHPGVGRAQQQQKEGER